MYTLCKTQFYYIKLCHLSTKGQAKRAVSHQFRQKDGIKSVYLLKQGTCNLIVVQACKFTLSFIWVSSLICTSNPATLCCHTDWFSNKHLFISFSSWRSCKAFFNCLCICNINKPHCENFKPGPTQTGLYSHRGWLET